VSRDTATPRPPGQPALCAVRTSMPVMTHTIRRVTYRGNPAFASMLVQMLEQEGATVKWERPLEQRGMGEMAQEVIVQMVATGGATAIAAAIAKFRKHMRGREEATVENDDLED
jgi:hypothetical protein